MKTVAVIASCDTKEKEALFIMNQLEQNGVKPLIIDMGIGPVGSKIPHITREEVASFSGENWYNIKDNTKAQLMAFMTAAITALILDLYTNNRIDGVLSVGGVQNTTVATAAMRALPIGFPTIMSTTLASGCKNFGDIVGTKDVITVPSIADFSGINSITAKIIANACGAMAGMVKYSPGIINKSSKPTVGISLMGVTNKCAIGIVNQLEKHGVETIGFHATGVGGSVLEQQGANSLFDGIIDLTTHEVTAEYFGGGFSAGTAHRLKALTSLDIPVIVSTGGLDFIDYNISKTPFDVNQRKYIMHNAQLAHIKITKDEAPLLGRDFANRLEHAGKNVTVAFPTQGMRSDSQAGEALHDPTVDDILISTIKNSLRSVATVDIPGNLNTIEWGESIANLMLKKLNIIKEVSYNA